MLFKQRWKICCGCRIWQRKEAGGGEPSFRRWFPTLVQSVVQFFCWVIQASAWRSLSLQPSRRLLRCLSAREARIANGNGDSSRNLKEIVMHNTVHADLVAKDSVPHKSHINVSNRDAKPREEAAALSGDDVLVSIADLWNQLVGLRRQVEWLGD